MSHSLPKRNNYIVVEVAGDDSMPLAVDPRGRVAFDVLAFADGPFVCRCTDRAMAEDIAMLLNIAVNPETGGKLS